MAATAYEDDVVELAHLILGIGLPAINRAAYRPGTWLFRILDSDEFDELTIDVSGQTSILGEAVAVLEAVQLAFGAAVAAVDYRIQYEGDYEELAGDAEEEVVRERLRQIVEDPAWQLEILELDAGSFRAKLRMVATRAVEARGQVLKVAGIVGAVFTAVNPPVGGVILASVAVAGGIEDGVTFLVQRMRGKQQQDRQRSGLDGDDPNSKLAQTRDNSQVHRFEEDLQEMHKQLEQIRRDHLRLLQEIKVKDAKISELVLALDKTDAATQSHP